VHWPDPGTSFEATGGVLADLVREGKIRHAGVSNFAAGQIEELARHGPVETLQPPYHLFRREIEAEILPYAGAHDIGVLVYGPLAHGLLSGRMTPETTFAADDWRASSSDFSGETFRRNLQIVERLKAFAADRGISLPRLAVAWTLSHPDVDVALVGARRPSQLDDTLAAADVRLSAADREEIGQILAGAAPVKGATPEGM